MEQKPHRHQLNNKFTLTIKEVFETIEATFNDMKTSNYSNMIEPIVDRNFFNTFHHQNGPNHLQYVQKHTGQKYQIHTLTNIKELINSIPERKLYCIWT